MIELYTSEGCSSCPPAENYLNKLKQHPELWKSIFPLAFHVDYWNHLGWKDRFSKARYSQRQRDYARYYQHRNVYTPAFFANGKSWRSNWFNNQLPIINMKSSGILKLKIENNQIDVHFQPETNNLDKFILHLAIAGMGLKSKIQSGENTGRQAEHEFVVLEYLQNTSHTDNWKYNIPETLYSEADEIAIVSWISTTKDPTPIQITGGPYQSESIITH